MSHYDANLEMYARERIILEIIKKNPDSHHNALLKIVVPEFMAKTTFEKTRNSLLEKNIISVQTKGNMKFYHLTENYEIKLRQHIEQNTNNSFHDLKLQIKRLQTDYSHKDIDEKILIGNSLLKHLLQTDNGFTILDSIKNHKKTLYKDEHLIIQQLIYQVFEMMRNDKDSQVIFSVVETLRINVPKNLLNK